MIFIDLYICLLIGWCHLAPFLLYRHPEDTEDHLKIDGNDWMIFVADLLADWLASFDFIPRIRPYENNN